MKGFRNFDIQIFKLADKEHDFNFKIDNQFFDNFENSILDNGLFNVDLRLNKTERLLELNFQIKGSTRLVCDRSLETFEHPIEAEHRLIFKFGEEELELDENLFQIPKGIEKINLAQHIYELISLSIPMKRLHPDYREDEASEAVDSLVYIAEGEKEEEDLGDPRFKILEKLKKDNNSK